MKKKNNHYTFMFFPEGKGSTFTLRIHRYTLYLTIVSIVLIVAGLSLLLYKTGEIGLKLQLVQGLREENSRLKEHNRDLQISTEKIANIDSLAEYLHKLADLSRGAPSDVAGAPASIRPGIQQMTKVEVVQTQESGKGASKPVPSGEPFAASVPNIMPVDGWITQQFSSEHLGLDIAAAAGTPIRATAMGVIEDVRADKYYGLMVEVRHDNGFLTRYSHCSQILVSAGDKVNRGQTIALVGNTGRSTAPHLHYEVMQYGKYVDPMSFISSAGRQGEAQHGIAGER